VSRPDIQSAELQAAVATARAAWPALSLGEEAFAARLTALLADQPADAWARLHVADLYLACACAEGDAGAIAAFEEKMWPEIDASLARVRLAPDRRQDVMQDLRVILFVGTGKGPGKIAQYRGESDLRRWLRAAALRAGFRVARKASREIALDDAVLASVAVVDRDPGLAHLKESCRVELKHAFEVALGALPRRERLLLRQHHIDRLTIDELAALYQVHRATAARWVAKAREELGDAILGELGRRMQVPANEVQSLLLLVRSQLDVSLDRLLSVG
jgi:RNA polymerase sigma-70 factor (ECF subfamily)